MSEHNRRAMDDPEVMRIIDTSEGLTTDELAELKRLVAMTKVSRTIVAFIIGAVTLVGIDRALDLIHSMQQVK